MACRKGFTLIELLVVIAIIALLVSILMPSLTTAKHLAQRAACISNTHNIGVGMMMYANDYYGLIPAAVYNEGLSSQESWDSLLAEYIGETKIILENPGQANISSSSKDGNSILKCPSDEKIHTTPARSYSRVLFLADQASSTGYGATEDYKLPISIATVVHPGNTFMVPECHNEVNLRTNNWLSQMPYNYFADLSNPVLQGTAFYTPDMGKFHIGNTSNFLFFDGHSESLEYSKALDYNVYWKKI